MKSIAIRHFVVVALACLLGCSDAENSVADDMDNVQVEQAQEVRDKVISWFSGDTDPSAEEIGLMARVAQEEPEKLREFIEMLREKNSKTGSLDDVVIVSSAITTFPSDEDGRIDAVNSAATNAMYSSGFLPIVVVLEERGNTTNWGQLVVFACIGTDEASPRILMMFGVPK